jgi:hypothetical protein
MQTRSIANKNAYMKQIFLFAEVLAETVYAYKKNETTNGYCRMIINENINT